MSDLGTTYKRIGRAGVLIFSLTLFDKMFAVVKEMVVAYQFGISSELDVFNIALALPGIFVLIFTGALGGSLVPLYISWTAQSCNQTADNHVRGILFCAAIFFCFVTILGMIFSSELFDIAGYGFADQQKILGTMLIRLLFILVLVDGIAIVFQSLLHAQKKFVTFHIAPIFINITIITAVAAFYKWFGIYALVWGTLIGTMLKTSYMAVMLSRRGFHFIGPIALDRSVMQPFLSIALPLLGSELIVNVNILVDQIMATQLQAGSVAVLRYAFRVNDLPIQVVFFALSKAIFPYVSEYAQRKDFKGLQAIFKQCIVFLGFIALPVTGVMCLFGHDIVSLLFLRGGFDVQAAQLTTGTVICYSLGLLFYSYGFINGTFFSALQDTKPLMYMGLVTVVMNVVFNYVFMHLFGLKAIALSTSLSLFFVSVLFLMQIKKKLKEIDFVGIGNNLLRICIATFVMVVFGYCIRTISNNWGINVLVYLPCCTGIMLCVYGMCLWKLRTEELDIYFIECKKIIHKFTSA